jgi:hypothetical protein
VETVFGPDSEDATLARIMLDRMGRAGGDVEEFFLASGRLADLERKAYARRSNGDGRAAAHEDDVPAERAVLVKVSSVKAEKVEWEWMHRLPRGKVTVMDGDPGLGKSTVTLDLIARRTRGWSMPGDERELPPTGAVILTAEDGIADTVRPRLEAAGADLDRVAVLTAVRDEKGRPRLPVIPEDVEAVREAVRKMGARLLVVDPLMAFLAGRVDSHRDQDIRGALALLSDLAEREAVAAIIIRHLNKTMGGHPIYRGGGSIGIIGAARAGLLVAPDPKDETRRVLAVSKSNLGPIPPSLAYRLVQAGDVSKVEWVGIAECTAKDLLVIQADEGDTGGARGAAEAFLRELLAGGPVSAKDARRQADEAGIAWRTLRRAQVALGVRATRIGGLGAEGRWYWEMDSAHDLSDAKTATDPLRGPIQKDGHLREGLATLPDQASDHGAQAITAVPGRVPSEPPPAGHTALTARHDQPPVVAVAVEAAGIEAAALAVYRHGGADYHVGDRLPDGRVVLEVTPSPVLSRRPEVRP